MGGIVLEGDIQFIGGHVAAGHSGKVEIVFLADFVQAGEAYKQEYGNLSFVDKVKNWRNSFIDQVVFKHDKPTPIQLRTATQLCSVLKSVFNIRALGGRRAYKKIATDKGRACPGDLGMEIVKLLRSELKLLEPGR
ncbi:MAG TPA: hypothetical protein VME63_05255 [Dyella sp.]|uniref:hypothetical protein n=1 Tax=Dyella sp. TaxID=1869338 RepID=UPI002BEF2024|nr:hypothetical protein [Dyella sp.]HTV84788.1 hypothetical protein [Dyella sp.]